MGMQFFKRTLTKLKRHDRRTGNDYIQYIITIPKNIAEKFDRDLIVVFLEDQKILVVSDSLENALDFIRGRV